MKRYNIDGKKVFQWYSYDCWGNERDGFEVNDIHSLGIFIIEAGDCDDEKAWKRAIRKAIFNPGSRKRFDIEWLDETMVEITFNDGFMVGRFELVTEEYNDPIRDMNSRWGIIYPSSATVLEIKNGIVREKTGQHFYSSNK